MQKTLLYNSTIFTFILDYEKYFLFDEKIYGLILLRYNFRSEECKRNLSKLGYLSCNCGIRIRYNWRHFINGYTYACTAAQAKLIN